VRVVPRAHHRSSVRILDRRERYDAPARSECIRVELIQIEWHPVDWSSDAMRFVGRMSASVFVGSELSRNPDWQNLTITYTTNAFFAIRSLRSLPGLVRPMIHWFLPECKKVREQVKHARSMLQPIIDKQRLARKSSSAGNQPKYHDTIGWMEETAAGRPFDPEAAQLGFALSALHTTSNLMKQALYDICLHPELIQPLRDEVSKAVSENGWSTAGVFQMQLLDSVIKESQRLKPAGLGKLPQRPFWPYLGFFCLLMSKSSQLRTEGSPRHCHAQWGKTSPWHQHRRRHVRHVDVADLR